MQKLLLAVDGSESSKKATQKAVELADALNSEVFVVTVLKDVSAEAVNMVSPSMPTASAPKQVEEIMEQKEQKLEKKGQEILAQAESKFKEKNLEIKKMVRHGDPADNICQVASEENCDMIILADKGCAGVKRFLLGSNSDKVVRHAETSVLIVK